MASFRSQLGNVSDGIVAQSRMLRKLNVAAQGTATGLLHAIALDGELRITRGTLAGEVTGNGLVPMHA